MLHFMNMKTYKKGLGTNDGSRGPWWDDCWGLDWAGLDGRMLLLLRRHRK